MDRRNRMNHVDRRVVDGHRRCLHCHRVLPLVAFRRADGQRRYNLRCRSCIHRPPEDAPDIWEYEDMQDEDQEWPPLIMTPPAELDQQFGRAWDGQQQFQRMPQPQQPQPPEPMIARPVPPEPLIARSVPLAPPAPAMMAQPAPDVPLAPPAPAMMAQPAPAAPPAPPAPVARVAVAAPVQQIDPFQQLQQLGRTPGFDEALFVSGVAGTATTVSLLAIGALGTTLFTS
ncbi:hypothetical protein GGR57DRAFT_513036 [Xylariaceae sp. FL1272]|nr:hypothetical protein GGR57DRAFT_513036 [Xylariaceae sp. FL1272]